MKHTVRKARNILAIMLAVLLTVLTASIAATAAGVQPLVVFVNEYATESVDEATGLTIYKSEPEVLASYSVEAGGQIADAAATAPEGAVVYDGPTPIRLNDESFGKYEFAGWTVRTVDGEGAVSYEPAEFPFTVEEDTTFYASFTGIAVQCSIDFRSDGIFVDPDGNLQPTIIKVPAKNEDGTDMIDPLDGSIVYEEKVNPYPYASIVVDYGQAATPPANNPVSNRESDHYDYVFQNWDYDYTKIYRSGSINAVYKRVGKEFKFEFRDYDDTVLGERTIAFGEACTDVPPVAQTNFGTNEMNYSFHNQWNTEKDGLQTGKGEVIDMNNVTFYTATPNNKGKIVIYAQYWQQLREFFFSVRLIDSDGEPAADVGVQVTGTENQLLTTFTDKTLGHNGGVGTTDEDGWVKLSVPYQESYTLSAYDPYYNLAVQKTLTLYDIENEAQITLQLGEPYELNNGQQYCNDVCHSFIGGLWITGLNLFYRLFKVKYVCCYDMYATHGDKLVYASYSSGMTIDRS